MGKDDKPGEWESYRVLVPPEVRNDIKAKLLEAEMLGYSSFLKAATHITSELVGGNIPPSVAREARSYLELIMTAIAAKNLADKDKTGSLSVVRQLTDANKQARKKAKEAPKMVSYDNTRDFIPDGLETVDGEAIPMEANWVGTNLVSTGEDVPGE